MAEQPESNAKTSTQVNADETASRFSPQESISKFLGNINEQARTAGAAVKSGIVRTADDLLGRPDLPDPASDKTKADTQAAFSTSITNPDWRVKLSVPEQFKSSALLAPLNNVNGFVFPYTPTIILSHSANYNSLQPVHTNYPFQIYNNSSVQEIVITGDFTVENDEEGRYWIGAIHYLRSVTKMFYGDSGQDAGSPPPLVTLNGYGDYVFNDVPCVVTNFTVDLPSDVDYIAVPMAGSRSRTGAGNNTPGRGGNKRVSTDTAWAPAQSLITVTLQPTYSRKQVAKFSLNDFVNGEFIKNGRGFI